MKRRYAKYELGRWLGVIVILLGLLMLAGADSILSINRMMGQVIVCALTIMIGILIYKYSKYKEMYQREKRKRAQERQLQVGA